MFVGRKPPTPLDFGGGVAIGVDPLGDVCQVDVSAAKGYESETATPTVAQDISAFCFSFEFDGWADVKVQCAGGLGRCWATRF
jgi:hypothetical protein